MATKLFVGNLSYDVTDEDLNSLFAQAGTVVSATVIIDKFKNRSKGFGFVEMGSEAEAKTAIDTINDQELKGRKIFVNEARPREERPAGGFNRGGSSRGGYSR
jgi:cold-inducible RNA-binding protein